AARVPAEVVQLVAAVGELGLADQPAVLRRARVGVDDADRVLLAVLARRQQRDVRQLLGRRLGSQRGRRVERRIGEHACHDCLHRSWGFGPSMEGLRNRRERPDTGGSTRPGVTLLHSSAAGASPLRTYSERYSRARALTHSRRTVRSETPSAAAISASSSPPKKRSSTTCLCRDSSSSSAWSSAISS